MGKVQCIKGIRGKLTKGKIYNYFIKKKMLGFVVVKMIDDENIMTWYPISRFKEVS